MEEQEAKVYYHNHELKSRCAAVLILLALVTFFVHQAMTTLSGPGSIVQGTTFHDYDSFIAYMEQDIPYHPRSEFYGGTTAPESAVAEQIGETTYYDEFGNVITEEEARHRILKDKNGNVVCEYIDRNETVASMSYSPQDGTVLPITVRTYEDLAEAESVAAMRHVIFGVVYMAEVLAVVMVYFLRRKK